METSESSRASCVTPFGLTFGEPVPIREPSVHGWADAVLDAERGIAMLDGRPLAEMVRSDAAMGSSPTETDGKDPIAVDSDPLDD